MALAQRGPGGGGPGGGGPGGGGHNNPSEIGGAVSNLAVDGSSFTLTGPRGETVTVDVTSATTIKNASDGSTATLANGEDVFIAGKFDKTDKVLTATAIVVDDHKPQPHGYFGSVTSLAADGSSFTLTGPRKETLAVTVSSATPITNYSDGSVAILADGENVLVTGTLDTTGKTLAAASIVVDDRKPPTQLQLAAGTILSLEAKNETFLLTVAKANFKPTGITINVVTTATTAYGGPKGKLMFADLKAGAKVQIAGTFDAASQTLTATRIEIVK
ncbi:uncharacterized protein KY384_000081 [Bacidia gigantensis]|uniref:uncharacterized protein n=1 Tax=Bacidia gigantensis TaxID=2732470 RepID=UPI001D055F5E|nr:uncharacterized protein KY384_000081 [Bacidia gigantensis]KAG8526089.1 hypothetical protein KY384_000081 [Bacidia gigantensis]